MRNHLTPWILLPSGQHSKSLVSHHTSSGCSRGCMTKQKVSSGVARNLIGGGYVLTSHCNFKTRVNVSHVNGYWFWGYIYRYAPPSLRPWRCHSSRQLSYSPILLWKRFQTRLWSITATVYNLWRDHATGWNGTKNRGGCIVGGGAIWKLRYADDTTLLATYPEL